MLIDVKKKLYEPKNIYNFEIYHTDMKVLKSFFPQDQILLKVFFVMNIDKHSY